MELANALREEMDEDTQREDVFAELNVTFEDAARRIRALAETDLEPPQAARRGRHGRSGCWCTSRITRRSGMSAGNHGSQDCACAGSLRAAIVQRAGAPIQVYSTNQYVL
jgi:hypothetical protein